MRYEEEYKKVKVEYEVFLMEIIRAVENMLKSNDVPIAFDVKGRVKSYNSILEKVESGRVRLKGSITKLNDLVGLRIVLLFPDYKEEVLRILHKKFNVIKTIDPKNANQFGYSSIHLLLSIKKEWNSVPPWENHSDKKIEVQVRTLSEHIYAETSHALFYKREESIPLAHNRDLSKLSALLEIVDDKLRDIKVSIEKHFLHIMNAPYEEILEMDLNAATFKRVMRHNSNELYDYDNQLNHILSSRVERDFNILKADRLDELIKGRVKLEEIDEGEYVKQVLNILEEQLKEQLKEQKDISPNDN